MISIVNEVIPSPLLKPPKTYIFLCFSFAGHFGLSAIKISYWESFMGSLDAFPEILFK